MEQTLASVSFDIATLKKSADEAKDIFRQMQAIIDKLQENKIQLNGISNLQELKANREEAGKLGASLEQLNKQYNDLLQMVQKLQQLQQGTTGSTIKLKTAIEQLNQQYKEAVANAKNMLQTYGKQSKEFEEATAAAAKYKMKLDEINATTKEAINQKAAPVVTEQTSSPIVSTTNASNGDEERAAALATGEAVSNLEKQEAAVVVAAQEWGKAQAQAGQEAAPIVDIVEEELTAMQQLAETYAIAQQQLNATNLALKENEAAYKANEITEAQYLATLRDLTAEQAILKQNLALARTELTAQAKTALDGKGAYALLNDQYVLAKKNALDIGAEFGKNSVQFKAAAAEANKLGTTLKELDSEVGINTREVGSYTSSIEKAFGKLTSLDAIGGKLITSFARMGVHFLAFSLIMKGLELAINAVTEAMSKQGNVFDAVKEAHRDYVAVVQEGQKNSEKEITNLQILEKVATDVTKPMNTRLDAVQKLQAEYPDYLGNLSKEAILSGQAAGEIDKLSSALFQKAYAEAAANKAAELGVKNLDLQDQARFLYNEQQKELANINKLHKENNSEVLANGAYIQNGNGDLVQAQQHLAQINDLLAKNRQQQIFNNTEIQRYIDEGAKFEPVLLKLSKTGDFTGATQNFKNYLADLLKAQQAGEQLLLQNEIKFRQSIADSSGFDTDTRVQQAKKASELRLQLIQQNMQDELAQNKAQEAEALKSYSDGEDKINKNTKLSAAERNRALAEAGAERVVAEAAFEQQRANIVLKADLAIKDETINTLAEIGKLRKAEVDKQIEDTKKGYEELKAAQAGQFNQVKGNTDEAFSQFDTKRTEQYYQDLENLHKRFQSGDIKDYENYILQKKALDDGYQKSSLGQTVQHTEALIDNLKTVPDLTKEQNDQILKLEQELAKAKAALYDKDFESYKDAEQKKTEATQKYLQEKTKLSDLEVQVAQQAVDTITAIVDGSYEKQIASIEKKQKISDTNYEKEITNVQNAASIGTLTAQQATQKQLELKAEETAADELAAKKTAELKQRQAKFDKMAQIAIIIGNGIQAEAALALEGAKAKALAAEYTAQALTNPLLAPAAAAMWAAVGVITAEQIATGVLYALQATKIATTPIPQYKYGTPKGGHKGGSAIVGEAFQPELVTLPTGGSGIFDTPTLFTDMPKGTIVTPLNSADINEIMNQIMYRQTAKILQLDTIKDNQSKRDNEQITVIGHKIIKELQKNRPNKVSFDYNKLAKAAEWRAWRDRCINW